MNQSPATPAAQIPKVSVVIAVYGNKEYLQDAIQSAIAQDYPNLDVWVIDDASTEQVMPELPVLTHSIPYGVELFRKDEIEYLEWKYDTAKPLHYIRLRSNGGPSRARNIGIANALQAGSHLIQVLDSDDIMYPNKVTELIGPILENPERVAGVYADYNILSQATGAVRYEAKPPFDAQRLFNGDCHIHSGCLINSLALRPFGTNYYPEDQRVCEDFTLWLKILKSHPWVFTHVAKPLTLVRSHECDSTSSVAKEIWSRDYQKAMSYR